jgi:hypothetical protein
VGVVRVAAVITEVAPIGMILIGSFSGRGVE